MQAKRSAVGRRRVRERCARQIKEYTGRYGFPEILIEVRAAFLELAECSPFAKSEEKNSHRFGIVVLKTGDPLKIPVWN
jgi:hypothetical protein